jgi:cytochrome c-type biogenesis protein CcmH/NrfG
VSADALLGASLGAALALFAFVTTGGVDLGPNTWAEIVVILIGAGLGAAAVLRSASAPWWGSAALCLFAVLTAVTIISISWSLQPSDSWVESNRAVSYLAAFGGALALARLLPERWPAMIGAIALLATVVCGYSLFVKVFPATLDRFDPLGRVNLPFNYWNAVGLMAAMGLPAVVWSGARRERARVLRALAIPAISILLTTIVLSYSRSAVIAALVGVVFWFVVVPLRLRGALVLALGAVGAVAASAWALATHALTDDNVSLAARTIAGHAFGLVLLLTLALMTAAGVAAAVTLDRVQLGPDRRRRIGTVLVVLVAMVPVAGIAGVAASSRGLTGEISHAWSQLTSPTSSGVSDTPGRLLAVDNSRGRYWNEALAVFNHNVLRGIGAGAFGTGRRRYTNDPVNAQHAHGYVFETLADLGLLGLFASLGLLVAWAIAALRAVGVLPARERSELTEAQRRERNGLLTLLAVVIAFGAQSAIDWTWFVPGVAIPALVCAGWLAGRGPLRAPVGRRESSRIRLRSPVAGAALAALAALVVLLGWAMLQPLRAQNADNAALTALSNGNPAAALADAHTAVNANPLSIDPLRVLSGIYEDLGRYQPARAALVTATTVQPQNALSWLWLGQYDLRRREYRRALAALHVAGLLDQGLSETFQTIAQALTAEFAPPAGR